MSITHTSVKIVGNKLFAVADWNADHSGSLDHATELTNVTSDQHHPQVHTIVSHDTTATGTELNTLTDDSMADTLHRHSELSATDGTPDGTFVIDADGDATLGGNVVIDKTTPITDAVRVTGEYIFTKDNELDYSASFTDGAMNSTLTFTELPTNTVAILVYSVVADTAGYPYIQFRRATGDTTSYVIGARFADGGINQVIGFNWIPTYNNTLYRVTNQVDTQHTFRIVGYKVGE